MFSGCISLKTLPDISNWDTSNVTNMSEMFSRCQGLIKLTDISKWNINKVKNKTNMFEGSSKIRGQIPTKFK